MVKAVADAARDAEVRDLYFPVRGQQNIVRLEVPVCNFALLMQVL